MVVFSLTLVRHGETVANKKNIIQGQKDWQLSGTGIHQVKMVAGRLQNEKFTHVFASDLTRAADTAQIIVEGNKTCKCQVIHDKRLRERKFGAVEGKSYRELVIAARKENSSVANFTPAGAESIEQLRERARSFFKDLCEQMWNSMRVEEANYVPASIKRRHDDVDSKCKTTDTKKDAPSLPEGPELLVDDGEHKRRRRTDYKSSSLKGNASVGACRSIQENMMLERKVMVSSSKSQDEDHDTDGIKRSNSSSSSGFSSLQEGSEAQDSDEDSILIGDSNDREVNLDSLFCVPVTDAEVKGSITCPKVVKYGCPNVSLSPLLEHRLSTLSSVSSGRSSSFDDSDNILPTVADVLIVSHGGLMKELIRHFVDELQCKIPGGREHALRVSPNTGVSKFTISVGEPNVCPLVTCLLIHDKDHLLQACFNGFEEMVKM